MNTGKSSFKINDLVNIAVCAVLIAICSWISIPSVVPFTLQNFAVFFVLEMLGGKNGTFSILIYILMAAIGIPVLSGFAGGIGVLLGTTGGYVLGFIAIGLIYLLATKFINTKLITRIIAMMVGLLVCYVFGTAWFITVYSRASGPIGIMTALSWCVFPFIIPDIVKLALAITLASRIRKILIKSKS